MSRATHSPQTRRDFLATVAAAAAFPLRAHLRTADSTLNSTIHLVAREAAVPIDSGRTWRTYAYNDTVPGPLIRVRAGERLRVALTNQLPQSTTIHWHGLPVPNAMDGVPGVTQAPVPPGGSFVYDFIATHAGTYFYHSHAGLQLDRGLYGALIVDPADPPARTADQELVMLLDDWLDGSPEEAYAGLRSTGGGMGRMHGADGPAYAGYLANGRRSTQDASFLTVERGEAIRLRLINAASATTFRVGLLGHQLTVTHSDGQPVVPVTVDTLLIGMGERYDVEITTVNPGAWALIAGSVDTIVPGIVLPVVYTGIADRVPPVPVWPTALLRGRTLRYDDLVSAPPVPAPARPPRTIPLTLGFAMGAYVWTINGQAFPAADAIPIGESEQIRLSISNRTMMPHPVHLHGHFFRVSRNGGNGPVKDTILVDPMMGRVDVDFTADNPGRWFLHCHHLYHMEAGMARIIEYV